MRCPYCQSDDLKVTDSRDATDLNAIRRRRECQSCLKRFTTFETVELSMQVHKRDGRYEDFQRLKLLNGITAASRHTRVSPEQVEALTDSIIGELRDRNTRTISTTELGETVMRHLQELDPVACIRFACVYRRFKRLDELKNLMDGITAKDEELVVPDK